MTIIELMKSIVDGTIKVNTNKHNVDVVVRAKEVINIYEKFKDLNTNDINNIKKVEYRFTMQYINTSIDDLNILELIFGRMGCNKCKEFLVLVKVDDEWYMVNALARKEYNCQCDCHGLSHTFTNEIEVPTGQFIVNNHLAQLEYDTPKDNKWAPDYSMNTIYGLQNRARHLAGFGYAFTMAYGNVSVYNNREKNEVRFYNIDHSTIEEGFRYVGQVDCTVWRWMGCDKALHDMNVEALLEEGRCNRGELYTKEYLMYNGDNDNLEFEIEKGKWIVTTIEKEDGLICKMNLKEEVVHEDPTIV